MPNNIGKGRGGGQGKFRKVLIGKEWGKKLLAFAATPLSTKAVGRKRNGASVCRF